MAPKRSAPPPPVASSEETASDTDESEDEGVATVSPTPASKNPPAPPQNGEESDTSDEEEEKGESSEYEKEAPPPNLNPKQDAEVTDLKPSPSEGKKPATPFQRTWSTDDEVRILEALAAHRREHGLLPQLDVLVAALSGSLDSRDYGRKELQSKVQNLKRRYDTAAKKGELPSKEHDRRLFNLFKTVWGSDKADNAAAAASANGSEGREFDEMCELYPYLSEEVMELEAAQPGFFKRDFGRIDDDTARSLDMKIKKQRLLQMKLELRRGDLTKEVTKALVELAK